MRSKIIPISFLVAGLLCSSRDVTIKADKNINLKGQKVNQN